MFRRLVEHFSPLKDSRQAGKIRYRLLDILVMAVCAVVAGAETWEDIALYAEEKRHWLSTFLDLPSRRTVYAGVLGRSLVSAQQ